MEDNFICTLTITPALYLQLSRYAVSRPFVNLQSAVGVLSEGRISIPETRNFRPQYRHVDIKRNSVASANNRVNVLKEPCVRPGYDWSLDISVWYALSKD